MVGKYSMTSIAKTLDALKRNTGDTASAPLLLYKHGVTDSYINTQGSFEGDIVLTVLDLPDVVAVRYIALMVKATASTPVANVYAGICIGESSSSTPQTSGGRLANSSRWKVLASGQVSEATSTTAEAVVIDLKRELLLDPRRNVFGLAVACNGIGTVVEVGGFGGAQSGFYMHNTIGDEGMPSTLNVSYNGTYTPLNQSAFALLISAKARGFLAF